MQNLCVHFSHNLTSVFVMGLHELLLQDTKGSSKSGDAYK